MQVYKDTLDKQIKVRELQKANFGTMTHEEKKMNKQDLGHFKHKDTNF